MKLTLIEKRPTTNDVTAFIFKPENPLTWVAGQFMQYTLPHDNPDDRKTQRYFTISSAPFENNIMVTTRLAPQSSTFKSSLFALPIGGSMEAEGPMGSFTLNAPAQDFIFIAGGIGVTPYRSILLDLDNKNIPIRGKLLYANRDNNFVFKKELEELASKHPDFKILYFMEPEKIDAAAIKQAASDLKTQTFYISGPEPMVQAFEKMIMEMGAPTEHIKRDYFPGYKVI